MSTVEQLDVNALIPDGIEPVEALRVWNFDGKTLRSLNNSVWKPGEPLTAECKGDGSGDKYSWSVARYGMTRDEARDAMIHHNERQHSLMRYGMSIYTTPSFSLIPQVPATVLPDGYGFKLDKVTHDAPSEFCTCGIYAATKEAQLPEGNVHGKVKLWGKVVPGERGVRAEFAYPSEFHVHASLANNPVLKSFGVPIIVKDVPPPVTTGLSLAQQMGASIYFGQGYGSHVTMTNFSPDRPKHRMHWAIKVAVAFNLLSGAFNLWMGLH